MIEAQVKAWVTDLERVLAALCERVSSEVPMYRDVYYDLPDRSLTAQGRELRVRVVKRDGSERVVFTHKTPAVDEETGSRPEHEVHAESPQALDSILSGLGYEQLVVLPSTTPTSLDHQRWSRVPSNRGDGF